MSIRSVYLPEPLIEDNRVRIVGDEHRHLLVTRAQAGEPLEIFNGQGGVWTGSVATITRRETVVRINTFRQVEREQVELILALAIIRIAAFELAIEKAVEVGVTRIVPFGAARSNVAAGNRYDRWRRILVEASKQSKHYYLPVLDDTITFDQVLSIQAASKIVFAERDGGRLKSALAGSPVLYLIGPEGGWTDNELSAARDSGFHTVSLGAAILKAETAAIVGAALIRYELGN
jgi:16S rRNA (uracil1498-N3)-methyltransferase